MVVIWTWITLTYFKECTHTAQTANQMENIKKGFESDRTMETLKASYEELQKHPIIAVKGKSFGDIPPEIRGGQTGPVAGQGMHLIFIYILPLKCANSEP